MCMPIQVTSIQKDEGNILPKKLNFLVDGTYGHTCAATTFRLGGGGHTVIEIRHVAGILLRRGAHQPRVGQNRVTITYAHLEVAGILTVLDSKQDMMNTAVFI